MRIGLLIILMSILQVSTSQNQTDHWYFGERCGLDFSNVSPAVLLNSNMDMEEGTSVISDSAGNLLFYTNGIKVWNKNHVVMSNGNGLNGHNSSTNSALIIPSPGSSDLYYIFTTDAFFGSKGLCYSVVDMTLQGGLGAVTQKNIMLHTPVTEKLAAIRHINNQGIWVLAHGVDNNRFMAWKITSSGVANSAVISDVGSVHFSSNTGNGIGYMKFSPDGSKLALTIYHDGIIELFDFNPATGKVFDPKVIPGSWTDAYGIEFSPSGKRLYVSMDTIVVQFDLTAGNMTDIANSYTKIGGVGPLFMATTGALQLAPDGKIYWTAFFNDHLGVINQPNNKGNACDCVYKGVYLGGQHVYSGLPLFMASWFYTSPFQYAKTCYGDKTEFYVKDSLYLDSVHWNFGDPASGSSNTAYGYSATHVFSDSGMFNVKLISYLGGQSDTVSQKVMILSLPDVWLGEDTMVCSSDPLTLDAGSGFDQYTWQDGFSGQKYIASFPGEYWVEVTDNGCMNTDTIVLTPCENELSRLYVPNTFTPDGNGLNDLFLAKGNGILDYEILIYNRWGQKIYHSKDMTKGWNGKFKNKMAPQGNYFYLIKYTTMNKPYQVKSKKGAFLLLR
ncbi:MAG: gliding motility-associated C-terminal domain-containing protein [Bacteroidales bacterium]|nr:gliding motility-associated C-terminal domain-containing protein [Bacteroidales bacterium]